MPPPPDLGETALLGERPPPTEVALGEVGYKIRTKKLHKSSGAKKSLEAGYEITLKKKFHL